MTKVNQPKRMMKQQKRNLFGLELNNISRTELIEDLIYNAKSHTPSYLCAVNVHMMVEAQRDKELKNAVLGAHWAVTDGMPVKWAYSYFNKVSQPRLAGMDLTPELLDRADQEGLVVSVYGNTNTNLQKFKSYLEQNMPDLSIGALISPPFRVLSVGETKKDICKINNAGTHILLVSLGCPKQEKWMLNHSSSVNAVCLGIGNAVNTVIGEEKRPNKLIQQMGLEWLYRLLQNPKRLFKRYFYTNSKVGLMVLNELFMRDRKK